MPAQARPSASSRATCCCSPPTPTRPHPLLVPLRPAPAHGRGAGTSRARAMRCCGSWTSPCSSTTRRRRSTPGRASSVHHAEARTGTRSRPIRWRAQLFLRHRHGRLRDGRRLHPYPQRRRASAVLLAVLGVKTRRWRRSSATSSRRSSRALRRTAASPSLGLDRLVMLLAGQGVHPRRHRLPEGRRRARPADRCSGPDFRRAARRDWRRLRPGRQTETNLRSVYRLSSALDVLQCAFGFGRRSPHA